MEKIIICIIFLLTFNGCSIYSATSTFNTNKFHAKALQNTQKTDVIKDGKVAIIFTATYLNEIYSQKDNSKQFLLGIFEVNKKRYINKNKIKTTLNNQQILSIYKLTKKHIMYDNIVLKNHWAKYFIIKFKDNKVKPQNLIVEYKDYPSAKFLFK